MNLEKKPDHPYIKEMKEILANTFYDQVVKVIQDDSMSRNEKINVILSLESYCWQLEE